jgi:phosphoserine phosphatase
VKKKKTIIAIMYDFDKTLCTKDMQEYSFIPSLGIKPKAFWKESTELAIDNKMDKILSYMYLMIRKSREKHIPIKRDDFVKLGKEIEFFDGVIDWFKRINTFAKKEGVQIEHYIISSGLKEIVEGSKICKEFKEIFACEFHYDENGIADWPKAAVNYTAKTQFLFRINKGVLDVSNDDALNKYVQGDERKIPFRNMIYIGDGLTDVPCMKLVKVNGGQSIAVYQQRKKNKVTELLTDRRVDFISMANYSEGSELDMIVKLIIKKMAVVDELVVLHRKQMKSIEQK